MSAISVAPRALLEMRGAVVYNFCSMKASDVEFEMVLGQVAWSQA